MSYHPKNVADFGASHGYDLTSAKDRKELAEEYVTSCKAPSGMAASTIEWHLEHFLKGQSVGLYEPDGTTRTPAPEPADSDDVLHHVTVADVETLHGMVLTEDQAERIKDRLAQALTTAINEIRGENASVESIQILLTGDPWRPSNIEGMWTPSFGEAPAIPSAEPEPQQPGTHRRQIRLQWSEVASYDVEVEIDVPDGYEGDLANLIDVDNNAFSEGDVEGVPAGYTSNWLERVEFTAVDVNDREIDYVDPV